MSNWKDKDEFNTTPVVMANNRDVMDRSRQRVMYYTSPQSGVDLPPATDANTHCHPSTAALSSTVARRGSDASGSNNNAAIVQTFTIGNSEYDYNDDGSSDDDDDDEEGDDIHDIDDCCDYDEYSGVRCNDVDHDVGLYGSAMRLDDALVACGSSASAANVDVELSSSSTSSSYRHGLSGDNRVQSAATNAAAGGSMSTIVFVGGCSRVQQAGGINDDLIDDSIESYFDGGGGGGLGRLRRQRSGGSQQQLVGGGSWSSSFGGVRWTGRSATSSLLSCCCRNDDGSYGSSTGGSFCRRCLTGCVRSRPCLFFVYVIVVLVLISSCVSLILVGVLVAEPYVRVSTFVNSTCVPVVEPPRSHLDDGRHETVGNVTGVLPSSPRPPVGRLNSDVILQTCSCGKGCNSKYRCLRIHVRYQQPNGLVTSTILYDDETSLNRQCSFYPPCRSSRLDNEQAVSEYERRYGRLGVDPFPCWYNPVERNEVIQHRRFQLHHVINGIVWSSVLFLISIMFLAFVVRRKNFFRS